MTENGFDWHRLTGSETDVAAGPPRPTQTLQVGRILAIAALVGAGVVVSVVLAVSAPKPTVIVDADASEATTTAGAGSRTADGSSDGVGSDASPAMLTVDVDGAVARPGLVTLPMGSRLGDAIEMAGGFTAAADVRAAAGLNLAAPLVDGAQVTVLDRAGTATTGSPASTAGPASVAGAGPGAPAVIDLDHATLAELDTLPGVGPVTANKILAARDEAPFQGPDDLLTRKLVGPATFEKIKALVTADGR